MAVEGNYLTVILLNLIIAIAMILTPYLVHSLLAGGLSGTASTVGGVAAATVVTAQAKIGALKKVWSGGASMGSNTKTFFDRKVSNYFIKKNLTPPPPPGMSPKK